MEDILTRLVSDLMGRLTGPLTMRLFLQPAIAGFFALRDGLKDARQGRPPHFWRMVTGPPEARRRRLLETWKAVFKVFIMAVMLDCVYQLLVLRWIYPVESIVTATILAIIPYVALRGVTNRIARSRLVKQAGRSGKVMTLCLTACLGIGLDDVRAQDNAKEPPELRWTNSADLSLRRLLDRHHQRADGIGGQPCFAQGQSSVAVRARAGARVGP